MSIRAILVKALEEIQLEFGICIREVNADWVDASNVNGSSHALKSVTIFNSYVDEPDE